jgi:hypothetical protein
VRKADIAIRAAWISAAAVIIAAIFGVAGSLLKRNDPHNSVQQGNSGGSNSQQTTNGPYSPIVNNDNRTTINNPLPEVTLDHRGNLQVKDTPIIGRDSTGFDVTAQFKMWNAGEYEIKPAAMVVTCFFQSPELSSEQERDFANQSFEQLLHHGCRAWSPIMNAIEQKADYPGTIAIRHNTFMNPQDVTNGLANHTLFVYLFMQGFYGDSLSKHPGFDLRTKYCRYFFGPNFEQAPCPLAEDGISIAKFPQ